MTEREAKLYRSSISNVVSNLSDEEALNNIVLFLPWAVDKQYYGPKSNENDPQQSRVKYNDKLYKCLISHKSQSDWTPDISISLWYEIPDPALEWPEWEQPIGAGTGYPLGAKVSHNNKHWINVGKDDNEYEPGVWGWEEQ